MAFMSYRFLTALKVIFWINKIKNGIPFTNNMSAVINTSFLNLDEFLGDFKIFPCHVYWFLPSGLPFLSRNVFAPNSIYNVNILKHHRTVYDFLYLKNWLEIFNWWIPKFCVHSFACFVPLICLLGNPCLCLETLFIITTALLVGL